jgi:hypothetical protein
MPHRNRLRPRQQFLDGSRIASVGKDGNEDHCTLGEDAPEPPDEIADMRRPRAKAEITKADELCLGPGKRGDVAGGGRFRRRRGGAEPPFLQDFGKQSGGSLVKRRASADAKDGIVRLPSGCKLGAVDHGRLALILSGLGGFERGEAAGGLFVLLLMTVFGKPAPRLKIGKIVEHLLDRVGDALRFLGIEQTAARIALGKLETR